MISLVNVLVVYLIGMVILGILIKIIDVKGSDEFRDWDDEPDLGKIAVVVFLWPIFSVLYIALVAWAALWYFILPNKK